MTPEEIGSGVVSGGWEYVAAAYGITWLALIGYTVSLWLRSRSGGSP